jgi:Nif-specific regulatory protein
MSTNQLTPKNLYDKFRKVDYAASGRAYNRVSIDEIDIITEALKRTSGNKTRAASVLGMTPRQLRYRLEKLGI